MDLASDGMLLAQLMAQLLAFLGRQLTLVFVCQSVLALGLQGIAQLGTALVTQAWPVNGRQAFCARLRQRIAGKAKGENQPKKELHRHCQTWGKASQLTLFSRYPCNSPEYL
jgi:hypothetical protein